MQKQLANENLLDERGLLIEGGYSTSFIDSFMSKINAHKAKIYNENAYTFINEKHCISLSVYVNGKSMYFEFAYYDFENKRTLFQKSKKIRSFKKINNLVTPISGDLIIKNNKIDIEFLNNGSERRLLVNIPSFYEKNDLRCDLFLKKNIDKSLFLAIPFRSKKHFCFLDKTNLLTCSGYVKLGEKYIDLNDNLYGTFNWCLGRLPHYLSFYHASASGINKGKYIAFNFGLNFGSAYYASENIFYFDGNAYKLGNVHFDIPLNSNGNYEYSKSWRIRSDDYNVDIIFTPIMLNTYKSNYLKNKAFGFFSGTITVDDKRFTFTELFGVASKNVKHI